MRALKVLVVVMGVLIIVGTATLIAVIAHRMAAPAAGPGAHGTTASADTAVPSAAPPAVPSATPPAAAPVAPFARLLDEPDGTRISGMTAAGDRLAVALQGGGPDRIVLIDPRDGHVAGRLRIGH